MPVSVLKDSRHVHCTRYWGNDASPTSKCDQNFGSTQSLPSQYLDAASTTQQQQTGTAESDTAFATFALREPMQHSMA